MEIYKQLFEFTCKFIDIQIKKYTQLLIIGIGPDADINATLVLRQVTELLDFANELLSSIEGHRYSTTRLNEIFRQLKFYLNQEFLRGKAGIILDENNIHTPEMARLNEQQIELEKLSSNHHIHSNLPIMPMTNIQKQCEHDSHAIAFLILNVAMQLRDNPDMAFDENMPAHAIKVLKRNASPSVNRYNRSDILETMLPLHEKCKIYLETSTLEKSTEILSKDTVYAKKLEHTKQLESLLIRYQRIRPEAKLFTEAEFYRIGNQKKQYMKEIATPLGYGSFFCNAGIATIAVAFLVVAYLFGQDVGDKNYIL